MRDATIIDFIKDYNRFKRIMDEHLVVTDFRDYETYMYMRALYGLLIKIPLFKIFFSHELGKVAKKQRFARKETERIIKLEQDKRQKQQESKAFAEKIKP